MNVFLWIAAVFLALAGFTAAMWWVSGVIVRRWVSKGKPLSGAASGVITSVIGPTNPPLRYPGSTYRPTYAEQDPGYRSAMRDAGRGHLLP